MMSAKTGTAGILWRGGALAVGVLMLTACASNNNDVATADGGPSAVSAGASGSATASAAGGAGPQLASTLKVAPDIDDPDAAADELVSDPLEDWNRFVFDLNTLIYTLLQPVIAPYGVLPDERKRNVDNFVHNLSTPVILVNDILQGETDRAWVTTQRFFINTAGGLGFFDPAADMGLPKHSEDFGQTLGVWGAGDGPYIVFPIIGPSNPRDGVGRLVDFVTDPLFWLSGPTVEGVSYGRTYTATSSQVGGGVKKMEELRANSLDFYAAVRSLYTQSRRAAVRNQEDEGKDAVVAPASAAFDPDEEDAGAGDAVGEAMNRADPTDGDAVGGVEGTAPEVTENGVVAQGDDAGLGPQALRIQVRGNTPASE